MKKIYFVFALAFFALSNVELSAAIATAAPETSAMTSESVIPDNGPSAEKWENMSRKEKRQYRKSMRKELRKTVKDLRDSAGDGELVLLIILAIFIPPLAMALYDGISKRFWISLLLTLLFFVPGMIYTLVVILAD